MKIILKVVLSLSMLLSQLGSAEKVDALSILQKQIDAGQKDSLFFMGFFYEFGLHNVEKDIKKARTYYEKAAKHNFCDAFIMLGHIYVRGDGVDVDHDKAGEYYKQAVKKGAIVLSLGPAEAHRGLGFIYMDGRGSAQRDVKKALMHFTLHGDHWAAKGKEYNYIAARIWACHELLNGKEKSQSFIDEYLSKKYASGWSGNVANYVAGKIDENKFLEEAGKAGDEKKRVEQLCEAHYYIGLKKGVRGKYQESIAAHKKCMSYGLIHFIEHESSSHEMKRLLAKVKKIQKQRER